MNMNCPNCNTYIGEAECMKILTAIMPIYVGIVATAGELTIG